MSKVDMRQVTRESLFLLAQIKVDGQDGMHCVKVRNLSSRGMMAEGDVKVGRGSRVSMELRDAGWIAGTVAWKQGDRFGIAFLEDIDVEAVRKPAEVLSAELNALRPARGQSGPTSLQPVARHLRKI